MFFLQKYETDKDCIIQFAKIRKNTKVVKGQQLNARFIAVFILMFFL